jgi:hypothetical protein
MEMHREMVLLAIEALLMEALLMFGVVRMASLERRPQDLWRVQIPSYQPCQA